MQEQKPKCKLTGEDGNIFNLIGIAVKCLRKAGQPENAKAMRTRIFVDAHSYDEALAIMSDYVEVE